MRHGEVASSIADRPDADAAISDVVDAVLSVQSADCVPILVADPQSGSVAAIHAGWRGTCAGVASAAIAAMQREFAANPETMVAALGPSIGACCYTVGADLIDAFREAGASSAQLARWFVTGSDGSLRLDLWRANRELLAAAGVSDKNIHTARLCTKTHAAVFPSYRDAGAAAGRLAGLIRVPTRT